MSQTRTLTVTFTGAQTISLPGGRFLFIKSATLALDIELTDANGTPSNYIQVGAGARVKRLDGDAWRFTKLTSGGAQTVTLILSDDAEFDVANSVTVTGGVATAELPSSTVATPARITRTSGGATTIAANLSRRRITICNPSDNATPGILYVQAAGAGAGIGYPLDPGMSAEFRTTAALDVRNDSGASVDFTQFEET